MKFWQSLVLLIVFFAGLAGVVMLAGSVDWLGALRAPQPLAADPAPAFQFRYVGKEKWSNVFVMYRMNRYTGRVDRIEYLAGEEDAKTGVPSMDQYSVTNVDTGERTDRLSEHDAANLRIAMKAAAGVEAKAEALQRRELVAKYGLDPRALAIRLAEIEAFEDFAALNRKGYAGDPARALPAWTGEQLREKLGELLTEKRLLLDIQNSKK
jgi:hypothetical protein